MNILNNYLGFIFNIHLKSPDYVLILAEIRSFLYLALCTVYGCILKCILNNRKHKGVCHLRTNISDFTFWETLLNAEMRRNVTLNI